MKTVNQPMRSSLSAIREGDVKRNAGVLYEQVSPLSPFSFSDLLDRLAGAEEQLLSAQPDEIVLSFHNDSPPYCSIGYIQENVATIELRAFRSGTSELIVRCVPTISGFVPLSEGDIQPNRAQHVLFSSDYYLHSALRVLEQLI